MDRELIKAAVSATRNVFSTLFSWNLRVDGFSIEKGSSEKGGDVSAIISYSGTVNGAFILHCSASQAAVIASAMLDSECGEDSEETRDAIGELLNMIVGGIKGYYNSERDPFRMSIPVVVQGMDYTVHVNVECSDEVSSIGFARDDDGTRIGLQIVFKE